MSPTTSFHYQGQHSTAYQDPQENLASLRSSYLSESQLGGQSSSTVRTLLQSDQQGQSQQQGATNPVQDVADAQKTSAAGQNPVTTGAAAAEARPEVQADMLPSGIQQYQPSNEPLVNTDRLISAAVTQASQLMGNSIGKYQEEDQFDAWPLVNPPFQEALHEVSQPVKAVSSSDTAAFSV